MHVLVFYTLLSSVSLSDTFRILLLVLNADDSVWSSEGDLWPDGYNVDTAKIKSERQ